MADLKRAFQVGDRVKWAVPVRGGRGNCGKRLVEHEGVITKIYPRPSQAKVEVSSVNKRTGKPNKAKVYMPRLSALTLVERVS